MHDGFLHGFIMRLRLAGPISKPMLCLPFLHHTHSRQQPATHTLTSAACNAHTQVSGLHRTHSGQQPAALAERALLRRRPVACSRCTFCNLVTVQNTQKLSTRREATELSTKLWGTGKEPVPCRRRCKPRRQNGLTVCQSPGKKIMREHARWGQRDTQERHCVTLYTPTHKHDTQVFRHGSIEQCMAECTLQPRDAI